MSLFRLFSLGLVALCCAAEGGALTVQAPQFSELVAQSDAIVRTEVTASRCEWRQTASGPVIVTVVTLRVEATVKGAASTEIQLQHLGGQIGDRRLAIPGLPQFVVGDRDYLFIEGNGRALCPLVAIPHGRYPLVRDPADGAEYVARADGTALASLAAVSRPLEASSVRLGSAELLKQMPMRRSDFEAAIRGELARQGTAATEAR